MDIRGVAASCGLKVGEKGEVGSGLSIISIGLRRILFFFPVFFFFFVQIWINLSPVSRGDG